MKWHVMQNATQKNEQALDPELAALKIVQF